MGVEAPAGCITEGVAPIQIASFAELVDELSTAPASSAVALIVICPVAWQFEAVVPVTVYTIWELGVAVTVDPVDVFSDVEGDQT